MIAIQLQIAGDKELEAAFVQVENIFKDLSPIFEAIEPEALGDIRNRIENHPGPPLALSTIKKKGHARILRDSDDLYGSFAKGAAGNISRIGRVTGEFGSSDTKGMFHQLGTTRMPRRTIIQITGQQEAKYTRIAVDVLNKSIGQVGFQIK